MLRWLPAVAFLHGNIIRCQRVQNLSFRNDSKAFEILLHLELLEFSGSCDLIHQGIKEWRIQRWPPWKVWRLWSWNADIRSKTPSYVYKSLREARQIRILCVRPAKIGDSVIQTCFEPTTVNNEHTNYDFASYVAILYMWGQTTTTAPALIDGRLFQVKSNVHDLLLQLPHRWKVVRVWIDTICTDQQNILERNQQVAMMGHIYGIASEVVVWLWPVGCSHRSESWNGSALKKSTVLSSEQIPSTNTQRRFRRPLSWHYQPFPIILDWLEHGGSKNLYAPMELYSNTVRVKTEWAKDWGFLRWRFVSGLSIYDLSRFSYRAGLWYDFDKWCDRASSASRDLLELVIE